MGNGAGISRETEGPENQYFRIMRLLKPLIESFDPLFALQRYKLDSKPKFTLYFQNT